MGSFSRNRTVLRREFRPSSHRLVLILRSVRDAALGAAGTGDRYGSTQARTAFGAVEGDNSGSHALLLLANAHPQDFSAASEPYSAQCFRPVIQTWHDWKVRPS